MLYSIFISPIETIVDWAFCFFSNKFSDLGIIGAVCGVSLVINFLALPIYNIADAVQDKERRIAKALEPRVKQIKKAFKGDEQFMILSTYYRQNDYSPVYVLRGSISILIQIPFFMAAYHYLSNNEALQGSAFWIFSDLGAPDGLLHIGNFPIHILPIIMTLINFISGAIYTKGFGFKDKLQVYGIAAVFLLLLYNSPSGLVIYWILNNLFSLVKNAVKKMKNPGKILYASITILLLAGSIYLLLGSVTKKKLFLLAFSLFIAVLPFIKKYIAKLTFLNFEQNKKLDFNIVLLAGIGLALLCGIVMPSSVIASSPDEFSFIGNTPSPLTYIWTAFFIFLGLFVIWPTVLCKMFGEKVTKWWGFVFLSCLIISLVNTYILKSDYGNLNVMFELDDPNKFLLCNAKFTIITVLAGCVVIAGLLLARKTKAASYIPACLVAICLAECSLGLVKINTIKKAYDLIKDTPQITQKEIEVEQVYSLSKDKQNVVVIFLDKGINTFIPDVFNQYPDIEKEFDGFTYYPNTLSFSNYTVEGAPPIYGGYEYTPEEMNARSEEMLRTKHDEAIMVLPKLFADAGFEATISDPPWPDYKFVDGYDVFDAYPEINAIEVANSNIAAFRQENGLTEDKLDVHCQTGSIDFSILQCLPPFMRLTFYKSMRRTDAFGSAQTLFSELANLYYLPEMTDLSSEKGTFTLIRNKTTHEGYTDLNEDLITPRKIQTDSVASHYYQSACAAFNQIAKWFVYLKENGVYDNTRIIIVSDHGRELSDFRLDSKLTGFGAMLLVKDFNETGSVKTDETFMTNADTLFIAKEGLPVSDINPFTGKKLTQEKDNGVNIYTCLDWNAPTNYRNDYQFKMDLNKAWHVSDDIFDLDNWIPMSEFKNSQEGK